MTQTKDKVYYQFKNILEFVAYCAINKEYKEKEIVWVKGNDYTDMFIKGSKLFDEGKHEEAIKILKDSLQFNPAGIDARFEIAENYIVLKDYENAIQTLMDTSDLLIELPYKAKFYRRLGYIFTEEENYELAYACFIQSKKYENNVIADNEIKYIRSKTKIGLMFNPERILKLNNIPILIVKNNKL